MFFKAEHFVRNLRDNKRFCPCRAKLALFCLPSRAASGFTIAASGLLLYFLGFAFLTFCSTLGLKAQKHLARAERKRRPE